MLFLTLWSEVSPVTQSHFGKYLLRVASVAAGTAEV